MVGRTDQVWFIPEKLPFKSSIVCPILSYDYRKTTTSKHVEINWTTRPDGEEVLHENMIRSYHAFDLTKIADPCYWNYFFENVSK